MHQLLKVSLLGAPQMSLDDTPVTGFITRKAEALFFYLVVTGRAHRRSALAALLWPDVAEQRAKKNLRDLLPSLRRLVGEHLIITRDTIAFNQAAPYWVDVDVLQTNLKHVTTATSIEAIRTATNLYRGEFLEGFHVREAPLFEEWLLVERAYLRELQMQGLHTLADRYMAAQDYRAALVVTQRLLAIEPWHEQAHRQQMLCLAYSGRTNEALAQYVACRQLLADELGLEPMAETTLLYEQIRGGAFPAVNQKVERLLPNGEQTPAFHPPLRPAFVPPPHNLPRQLTPFVGRTLEVAAISAKLQQADCVWLTLVGEGGVGKTRLAVKVGEALLSHFSDGVWFIPLLDIVPGDELPEQLAATIGKVLQLSFAGAEPLLPQVVQQLREKQLLLIFDNFEHLSLNSRGNSGAAAIYHLIQSTRQVKVFITSRHRLNYQAEHLFVLDGLPLPDEEEVAQWEEGRLPVADLLAYDGVALFVQRAGQNAAQFSLNEENAAAILRICRLVEGLPLGIELAATLVQRYTCTQIAAMLEQTYTTLTAPFHDLPMRHHSLQATLAYSWQLLSPAEAAILAQCAIFHDSFTFAAATAVTGATPAQLQRLKAQMLLHQIGPERYVMHGLMRQYALEQLRAIPVVEAEARDRHSLYFVEFLQSQERQLPPNGSAIAAMRDELGNICVSWDWAIQQGNFMVLRQLLPSLVHIYALAGSHHEIATRLQQSVATLQSRFAAQLQITTELQALMAQLLLEQAYFYITTTRVDAAKPLIQQALPLAHTSADLCLAMTAHQRWGDVAWAQGEYAQHRTAYEQALALAQRGGCRQSEVHCLSNLGMNDDMRGEYSSAIRCYETALALTRQLGDRQKENVIYNNLGVSSVLLGDFSQALAYYEETLQLSRQLGDQEGSGFANLNFGLLLNRLGDWERAQWYGERALKIFRMIGERRLEARALAQMSLTLHHLGETADAAGYCQHALHMARQGGYQAVQAEALTVWGQILVDRRQGVQAAEIYREAYALWQRLGRTQRALLAQGGLMESLLMMGDQVGALRIVETIWDQLFFVAEQEGAPVESVLLSCYRTLEAHRDSRAISFLRRGNQLLEAKAAKLQDDNLRQSFLQRIKAHHTLMALAQVASP
ncbi:MAG: BTAD domain-containing putative transcriptional regulator [Caldilineaceae bacterium]